MHWCDRNGSTVIKNRGKKSLESYKDSKVVGRGCGYQDMDDTFSVPGK